jgi:geranylgeranyl diphosphate synthase type II
LEDPAYYNLKLKGKNFRSAILFLLSRSLYHSLDPHSSLPFEETKYYAQVKALSACIEIAHNASLLQDDIIDRADQRRSQKAAHKVFGASNSVFSSDFMISRASRMLTDSMFETTHISQIFSTILYNLVFVSKVNNNQE